MPIGKNGKPKDSYFRHWPLERRIEKYMEFNEKFDLREDPDLVDGMSHRLHWDEHPAVWLLRDTKLSLEERIAITIQWSFSNEKWTNLANNPRQRLGRATSSVRRRASVLATTYFKIYYPKGTKVKEWLVV